MFGLRRFRFRSPERDRETMERRLALIQRVVRSGIAEAEAESKGLRTRLARTRRSVMSVLAQVQDRETDPACRVELTTLLNVLLSLANNKASLNWNHLTVLRKLERRLHRLIDQPRVSALGPPSSGPAR
jgi:hypothetical protein